MSTPVSVPTRRASKWSCDRAKVRQQSLGWPADPPPEAKHYAVYPANLCPLLSGDEFAEFGGNLGEAVCHAVEYGRSGVSFRKGASKHLDNMLGGLDGVKAAGKVGEE